MKNLTRVLSLVLILTMMVSSVAFAGTFTDIEAGSTYAEATSVLADLGILKGYEDGSFGPDKVITRAEVVAIVNRLQGLSDAAKAAGGTTVYTDVAADAWYAGDVNLATQMGIISGDGNGLFRPDDQVKYEEAVKMMVAACGYTQEYALSRGGWPTGYLVIATEQGISKGLGESAGAPAYRGIVAKLAYQALTAPMMVLNTYETTGIAHYRPDASTILLEKQLETYKLSGFVSANSASYIEGSSSTDEGKINYIATVDKIGKYVAGLSFDTSSNATQKSIPNILLGASDVDTTLGMATDLYITENADGKYEVVAYVVQAAKNNTVTIENTDDIQAFGAASKASKWKNDAKYLSVYDADTDTTNTTYSLADDAKVLLNGNNIGLVSNLQASYINTFANSALTTTSATSLGYVYAPTSGVVDLIDIDNDGYYEYVKVTSYETAVMDDEPYGNNTKLSTTAGTINLDFGNRTNASYAIVLDGEAADIADLKKDDVLSVAKTDAYHWTILASRSTVAGQVSECDTTSTDKSKWQLVVDGKTYVLANLYDLNSAGIDGINAGDEGTFLLDAFGNIALYDATSSSSKDYGFITAAGMYSSVGDTEYEVRVLDKDGATNTYVLAENVRVTDLNNAINGQSMPAADVFNDYISQMPLFQTGFAADLDYAVWVAKSGVNYVDYAGNAVTTDEAKAANYAGRIITFTVNSSGKISQITFAKADVSGTDYKNFTYVEAPVSRTYKAKTLSFTSSYGVAEDAVIFNLPIDTNSSRDDFGVIAASSLEDDEDYTVAMFSVNEDGNAGALVITSNAATVGPDQNLAVATRVMTANNSNGEKVFNITFVQAGEEKTLSTTNDLYNTLSIAKGDVFEYSVDADGAIDKIAFGTQDGTLSLAAIKTNGQLASAKFNENSNAKVQYVFGAVYDKFANTRTLNLVKYVGNAGTTEAGSTANIGRHVIPADAQVIVINCTKSNTASDKVVVGAFGDIQSSKWINGSVDEDRDYAVLVKYYKEEVTDVIVYKNYVNKVYYGN